MAFRCSLVGPTPYWSMLMSARMLAGRLDVRPAIECGYFVPEGLRECTETLRFHGRHSCTPSDAREC